jgi:hypothetical protein
VSVAQLGADFVEIVARMRSRGVPLRDILLGGLALAIEVAMTEGYDEEKFIALVRHVWVMPPDATGPSLPPPRDGEELLTQIRKAFYALGTTVSQLEHHGVSHQALATALVALAAHHVRRSGKAKAELLALVELQWELEYG